MAPVAVLELVVVAGTVPVEGVKPEAPTAKDWLVMVPASPALALEKIDRNVGVLAKTVVAELPFNWVRGAAEITPLLVWDPLVEVMTFTNPPLVPEPISKLFPNNSGVFTEQTTDTICSSAILLVLTVGQSQLTVPASVTQPCWRTTSLESNPQRFSF